MKGLMNKTWIKKYMAETKKNKLTKSLSVCYNDYNCLPKRDARPMHAHAAYMVLAYPLGFSKAIETN